MKLYFYGGSFDPPHLGHKEVINYFSNKGDKFLIIPTHCSPFKTIKPIPYPHRKAMLELMLNDEVLKKVSIEDYELDSKTPYTVDLVKLIKKKFPSFEINMIIGCDQLNNIKEWKDYNYIIDNVKLSVVSRPNFKFSSNVDVDSYVEHISIDISSSFIRKNITNIHNMKNKIDQDVIDYVMDNKLYL